MTVFNNQPSAAKGFYNLSKYMLDNVDKSNGLIELLNVAIVFENFEDGEFEKDFDLKFREIFGDERIDYATSVTFIEPVQSNGILIYPTIKEGWKNSYWGRMTNWENKVNQFENVIKMLKAGKNTKRCEMIVYNPIYDMKSMFKQPCLLAIDIKPRGKDLYLTGTFRSQRITKAGYADFMALINMGKWLADECGYNLKEVTNVAHSLHFGGSENNELPNTKKIVEYFRKKI